MYKLLGLIEKYLKKTYSSKIQIPEKSSEVKKYLHFVTSRRGESEKSYLCTIWWLSCVVFDFKGPPNHIHLTGFPSYKKIPQESHSQNKLSGQLFQHPLASKCICKCFTGITAVFYSFIYFLFPQTKKRKQRRWASDTGVKLYSGALQGCETGRLVRHFNIRHVCFWVPRVLNPTRHWYSLLKANSSRNHSGPPRDDWAPRGGGGGGSSGGPFIRISESHPRTLSCSQWGP